MPGPLKAVRYALPLAATGTGRRMLPLDIYIYIYIYIYIHIYIYIYIYIHIDMYICISVCVCVHACARARALACIYITISTSNIKSVEIIKVNVTRQIQCLATDRPVFTDRPASWTYRRTHILPTADLRQCHGSAPATRPRSNRLAPGDHVADYK